MLDHVRDAPTKFPNKTVPEDTTLKAFIKLERLTMASQQSKAAFIPPHLLELVRQDLLETMKNS